jgi:MFS family permease
MGGAFWRLWWSTAISSSGDGLLAVALPLLAVTITRDPIAIAAVTVVQRGAGALVALPLGVVIDRFQRRTMMVGANVVSGLALLGLVLALTLGSADLAMIYVVSFVLAVCDMAYILALQASFPDIVNAPDRLGTANARLMGVDVAGEQFAGPAVGGLLFGWARRLPFLADGVSFFLAALLVRSSIPRPKSRLLHAGGTPGADGSADQSTVASVGPTPVLDGQHRHGAGWTADFRAGLRVFRRERALKLLGATMASMSFNSGMVMSLLVLYGRLDLHLSSIGYGVFITAASVFGVAGTLVAGSLERRWGAARVIVYGSFLVVASYLGLAFTHLAVVAVVVFGLQEVGVAIANVGSVTTRQRLIPRQMYGRVASVHRILVLGAAPVGALFAGVIASVFNVRDAFFIAGALEAVLSVYLAPQLVRVLGAKGAPPAAA